MPNPHGSFIWYELITTDPVAAGRFYADVIGWTMAPFGGGGGLDYTVCSAGVAGVAGMMALPAGADALMSGWYGYVGVDDVDAAVAAIVAAGGAVTMPATDMPGVGRMAMVADPQGTALYVMRGESDENSGSFDPKLPGHCSWNELSTTDLPSALTFYTALFGWTKGGVMPMGAMGDYQFIDHGGVTIGAMMKAPDPQAPPKWNFYFRVDDIDAAAKRANAGGANILYGPAEVPGGDNVITAIDPLGAIFSLVGPRGPEAQRP